MKYILGLSKQDFKLSKFEAEESLNVKSKGNKELLLVNLSDKKAKAIEKLAYTNHAYEVLFESSSKELLNKINKYNWQNKYKKNYCVRCINLNVSNERKYADIIWNMIKKPKVDLENANTEFVFIKLSNKIFVTKLIWKNEKKFLGRKAHLRPELHPSSLDPRLAKACVNIAVGFDGEKGNKKKKVLDPFCGTCGILIEAGLLGHNIIGCDLDEIMARKGVINLEHYNIKKYEIGLRNALSFDEKVDAVVTDIPYGKNTKANDIEVVVKKFLENTYKFSKKVVIMFPFDTKYKKLIGKWKVKAEFKHYLHKSLSKRIVVLVK
jgi:tRNA (guanine10-N2)-dimethyltransferase